MNNNEKIIHTAVSAQRIPHLDGRRALVGSAATDLAVRALEGVALHAVAKLTPGCGIGARRRTLLQRISPASDVEIIPSEADGARGAPARPAHRVDLLVLIGFAGGIEPPGDAWPQTEEEVRRRRPVIAGNFMASAIIELVVAAIFHVPTSLSLQQAAMSKRIST